MILFQVFKFVAGDEELQMHAEFTEKGTLYAPVDFEHMAITLNTTDAALEAEETEKSVRIALMQWASNIMNTSQTQDYKRMRTMHVSTMVETEVKLVEASIRKLNLIQDDYPSKDERNVITDVFSFLGFTSGMYAAYEVHGIEKQVRVEHKNVETQRDVSKKLKNLIDKFSNRIMDEEADRDFAQTIARELRTFGKEIEATTEAIAWARMDKLHPSLFTNPHVLRLFKNITEDLATRNMRTVHKGKEALFAAEVSHIRRSDSVTILLHIATVKETLAAKHLYKMKPARVTQNGVALEVASRENWIAVRESTGEHLVLSDDEIDDCVRKGTAYLCPHARLSFKVSMTCAAALFFGKSSLAMTECNHQWKKMEVAARVVSATTFVTPKKTRFTVTCPDRPTERLVTNQLVVGLNCSASSENMVIHPCESSKGRSLILTTSFKIKPDDMGKGGDDYFSEVKKALDSYHVPPVRALPSQMGSMWMIIITVAVVLIIGIMGFLAYLTYEVGSATYAKFRKPKGEIVRADAPPDEDEAPDIQTRQDMAEQLALKALDAALVL